jgi:hypothetical protein
MRGGNEILDSEGIKISLKTWSGMHRAPVAFRVQKYALPIFGKALCPAEDFQGRVDAFGFKLSL